LKLVNSLKKSITGVELYVICICMISPSRTLSHSKYGSVFEMLDPFFKKT